MIGRSVGYQSVDRDRAHFTVPVPDLVGGTGNKNICLTHYIRQRESIDSTFPSSVAQVGACIIQTYAQTYAAEEGNVDEFMESCRNW